jgi:localization factor PodJL
MSAADERDTSARAARQRAMIAEIEARLAQFGRLTAQIREGLPEHHAQDLTPIEQGIGSLAQRIGALGREKGRAGEGIDLPPLPTVLPTEGDPWDTRSAEELMRVYEAVNAEAVAQRATRNPHPWPSQAAAPAATELPLRDATWLEARFAEIAALIERALADANPAPALASLDRRLDQFERRLDGALGDMAPAAGRGDLKLIDAHLVEFAGQVEVVRQQLNRLDTIDAQLRELALAIEGGEQGRAGPSSLSKDAVAELIDSAAERAAGKVVQSLPALGENRIDTLEALVRDHVAERRRNDEASAGVLNSIEDALVRIVDRVEAMEGKPAACAEGATRDCDGLQAEHDRLAEIYAEGARVLGQPALPPTLDAADYVAADRQQQRETSMGLARPEADDWIPQNEMARQELRASALRAKLKAQLARAPAEDHATEESPPGSLGPTSPGPTSPGPTSPGPTSPGPGSPGLLGPGSLGPTSLGPTSPGQGSSGLLGLGSLLGQEPLGQGRVRTWALAGSYRANLLLGVVMALLFGAGFMAVASMLAGPPAAGAQGQESVPQPGSRAGNAQYSPGPSEDHPETAPLPQPAPRQPLPDAASEDAGEGGSPPTPRLQRLQRGTVTSPVSTAAPLTLPLRDRAGAASAGVAGEGTDALARSARFTLNPAPGEADGEFEIAALSAEGMGVSQDPGQAVAWYERAAARGLAAAQFRLALALERGIGVAIDRERAKVWYGRAAEQGHVRAMHNLGVLLAVGERADYAAAARWFAQAAERGLVDSQFNLAVLHESGRGVTKDLKQAYIWFALAAKSGDAAAVRRLEQIAAQLQPAEVAAADQSVAAWHPAGMQAASPVATDPTR